MKDVIKRYKPTSERHNKAVTISLTEGQYTELEEQAKKTRMALSNYIKMLIFGGEINEQEE